MVTKMRENYLLDTPQAQALYAEVRSLPICDYHCHLSPQEIYEDRVFDNIGQMWLSGDHYKWRLMRQAGVPERFITGDAPWPEKFQKYAETVSLAGGNPLYAWSMMELSMYFGINTPLNGQTAAEIYRQAGAYIQQCQMSPRQLIAKAGVAYIATTDSPADSLEYHALLAKDPNFNTVVAPTFRPDELFKIDEPGFLQQLEALGSRAAIAIDSLEGLTAALCRRLDAFQQAGCRFSDLGIARFPTALYTANQADPVFKKALSGGAVTGQEADCYVGFLYAFLCGEYRCRGMTMQLHLAVYRDANSRLTAGAGRDTGSDCVGSAINPAGLIAVLDALNTRDLLPKMVIYTLNPQMNAYLAPICGSFPGLVQGAAWWYCDHRRGIEEVMQSIAETGYFGSFLGMLTDSRCFLSYARHDYFRRILCSLLARWMLSEDFAEESAKQLAADICFNNIKARCLT